ncbi:hypothetical protein LSH36_112g05036 [Paralvinella palmiformis]|uniref:DDE Tnp4 domain-containing protein n=1 Tax=Paralvinella palmiformis TaxID=53620 RepID=A0AAD9N9B9_9ANNE|nr:hypothetical protein LSH36_112g05036 [Paralvinella palmiformis]
MNELFHNIMADHGFCIRVVLALKLATLNIPSFTSKGRLASKGLTKTRRIARARIHVESCIGHLKYFKILSGVIPFKLKKECE